MSYIELKSDDVIRKMDGRISCTFDLVPLPESWIGKPVGEYAPVKIGRPRATLISDALLRVRKDLIAEFGPARYRVNFQYIDDAIGE